MNEAHLTLFNRYWDEECLKASKDLKEPSLSKAIIFCHWKFYAALTLITFIEVIYALQADSSLI
jgi:hypothetical protein